MALAKTIVKNGDEVIDTAKAADKVDNAVDMAKAASKADNAHDTAVGVIRGADGRADSVVLQGKRIDVDYLENNKGRIAQNSPIEIPPNATAKVERKNGYLQIPYEWNDGTYDYLSRWHTRTQGAPTKQQSYWVVERRIKGKSYGKNLIDPVHEVYIGENKWIPWDDWNAAKRARKTGKTTKQQEAILDNGHRPDFTQY